MYNRLSNSFVTLKDAKRFLTSDSMCIVLSNDVICANLREMYKNYVREIFTHPGKAQEEQQDLSVDHVCIKILYLVM